MPSQIGATLRDSHGIAQVKSVTGSKILRILKAHGNILLISLTHHFYGAVLNCFYGSSGFMILGNGVDVGFAPDTPEDLYRLIQKAVSIRKHLERNRRDKDAKFRLILVESRIHCLARHYKKTKKLSATLKQLVSLSPCAPLLLHLLWIHLEWNTE